MEVRKKLQYKKQGVGEKKDRNYQMAYDHYVNGLGVKDLRKKYDDLTDGRIWNIISKYERIY
jgi:hypothetical protein